MVNTWIKTVITVFAIWAAVSGCKNGEQLGYEIFPDSDNFKIVATDTTGIIMYTTTDDSVITSGAATLLTGSYSDPGFGKVKAAFLTQFGGSEYTTFPEGSDCDSIVLQFAIDTNNTYLGNKETPMTLYVNELTTDLYPDSVYYGSFDINGKYENTEVLSQLTFTPQYTDSIIRFKLPISYGQRIMGTNDSLMQKIFKGFLISNGYEYKNEALMRINPNASATKLIVYYHTATSDSLTFNYTISGAYNARFNIFKHDYSSTGFANQLNNPYQIHDTVAYLQGLGGTRIRVDIPQLAAYAQNTNGRFALTRAELVLKLTPDLYSGVNTFTSIDRIVLIGENKENGNWVYFTEYFNASTGAYSSVTLTDDKKFKINITKVVDRMVKSPNVEFYLFIYPQLRSTNFLRTVINTQKNSDPSKLLLEYGIFSE